MKNIGTWIHNYNNLNPEQQLEVAEAIVKDLEANQYKYTQDDKNKSNKVIIFLKKILESASQEKSITESEIIIRRFKKLSKDNRNKVLGEILHIIDSYIKKQNQQDKETICQREGHLFNTWTESTWKEKAVVWDAGPQGYAEVECHSWHRICQRCGFVEKVDSEPQELTDARKKKAEKARIRQLESELKKLKRQR